jgi:hypothetical protein
VKLKVAFIEAVLALTVNQAAPFTQYRKLSRLSTEKVTDYNLRVMALLEDVKVGKSMSSA